MKVLETDADTCGRKSQVAIVKPIDEENEHKGKKDLLRARSIHFYEWILVSSTGIEHHLRWKEKLEERRVGTLGNGPISRKEYHRQIEREARRKYFKGPCHIQGAGLRNSCREWKRPAPGLMRRVSAELSELG